MAANIITIVLDSVRYDRIFGGNSVQTPNIDKLANNSIRFNQAFSPGSWTVPAHGSLFTGELPSRHGSYAGAERLDVEANSTLAAKLSKEGYQTVGFSTNPWVSTEFDYDKGFDDFTDFQPNIPFPEAGRADTIELSHSKIEYWREVLGWLRDGPFIKRLVNGISMKLQGYHPTASAEEVNEEINRWLQERSSSEDFFAFINYMDAHEPYRIRPEYATSDQILKLEDTNIPWNHKSLVSPLSAEGEELIPLLYDSSIRYLDEQIGELLQSLQQHGYYEDSYIVLLSDHGQSLGENDYWGHGTFLSHDLLHVPMVIKTPSENQQATVSTPVSIRELHEYLLTKGSTSSEPTCRLTKLVRGNDDKRPVFAESHGPYETEHLPDGTASLKGYRVMYYDTWRLHRDLETDEIIVEKSPLASTEDRPPKQHLLEIEEKYYTGGDTQKNQDMSVSESTIQRLESLGYR